MNTVKHLDLMSKRAASAACLLVVVLIAVSCSDTGTEQGDTDRSDNVLNIAFFYDMAVPDPDIFYEIEGNQVVTSLYEGLVRYGPDGSTDIEPWLAEDFKGSADGLTYTFTLREGIRFHDGTLLDSEAAKFSFERRTAINSGSAYMLADVAGYETPNPRTFVVKLERPVSAFLDYLASPYGPKLVSPTLVKAKEKDGDLAQNWLKNHSAGTGPYELSEFSLGRRYVLRRFEDYWSDKPQYQEVEVSIIPDAVTQQLKLEGGDLDILHQQPIDTIEAFRGREGFEVVEFPSLQKMFLHLNPHVGMLRDKAIRQALGSAIDREALVDQVFKGIADVSSSMYPAPMSLEAPDEYEFDPSQLEQLVMQLPTDERKLSISYVIGQLYDQRMAEALQASLSNLGIDVSVIPKPLAEVFEFVGQDPETLPDIFLETTVPDSAHPDTWLRIFLHTEGGLNFLHASTPAADAAMDRGLHLADPGQIAAAYAEAGKLVHEDATAITLADVEDTFIARANVGNLQHDIATAWTINAGLARPE